MKTAVFTRPSRAATVGLVLSVAALSATGIWRHVRPAVATAAGSPLEELRRQADSLRGYTGDAAVRAAEREARLMAQLWTEGQLSEWKQKLPPEWMLQEASPRTNPTSITRRFVLERRRTTVRDWPVVYGFIRDVDALPTAVIEGLTLSLPDAQTRQFQQVSMILDLWFRPEDRPSGNAAVSRP